MKNTDVPEEYTLSARYEITVRGKLDAQWADWLNGMTVKTESVDGTTILAGTVRDQAALRGILSYLWDLGLTLLAISRTDPPLK
jgi:hypothetical protein